MSKSVMIIAGEVSGDMHAARLVQALKAQHPEVHCWGTGGPCLREAGVETVYDVRDLAVMGITEVLIKYLFFRRMLKRLLELAEERKPDVVLLVDYPGFNLEFARHARRKGFKILFYVCPQVWAWKRSRIQKMAARLDRLMVIFPFEVELFKDTPLQVDFVGHPLVEETRKAREAPPVELPWPGDLRIALLPGSRNQEVERILPVLLETASHMLSRHAEAGFLLAAASDELVPVFEKMLSRFPGLAGRCRIVTSSTREVLRQARAALVASGTATLEAALMQCPMIVVYVTAPLTYALARRVVKIPHIGMVNVVAGRLICPEFIQHEAEPERMSEVIEPLLTNTPAYKEMKRGLQEVTQSLGESAGFEEAARIVAEEMGLSQMASE